MTQLEPQTIRGLTNGVVTEGTVDESVYPKGAVHEATNWHFDVMGAVKTRPGITQLGDIPSANPVLGIHHFQNRTTAANSKLVMAVTTVVYYLSGSTWTSKLTGQTTGLKTRFMSFLERVWVTNGTDAMKTWDGNTSNSFDTTSAVSAPAVKYIENFRSRVWGGWVTAQPSRLYYSALPSSGAVLWTGSDTGYIDIAPGDGEEITALKKFSRYLLVFKQNHMYRVASINETEPDPLVFVGTYSQESVVEAKNGVYFHHPTGIYRIRRGESLPSEISKPISDFIQAVPSSFYTNVGSWIDSDHVYISLGDLTVNGITYNNCVARWTISSEVWTIYTYASELRVGIQYDNGSAITTVAGDTVGAIHTINSGKTDNGTPIFCSLTTSWLMPTGLRAETIDISKLNALCKNAQGMNVEYQNEKSGTHEFQSIGMLAKMDTIFNNKSIKGHKVRFRVSGANNGDPAIFQGFEIINTTNEGSNI